MKKIVTDCSVIAINGKIKGALHCTGLPIVLYQVTTNVYNVKEILNAYDGDLYLADMSVQFLY